MKKHKGYTPHLEFGVFVWYKSAAPVPRVVTTAKVYADAAAQLDRRLKTAKPVHEDHAQQMRIPDAPQPRKSVALETEEKRTKAKPSGCAYCYGFGLYASYMKYGWRRPMEKGVSRKPKHPNEPVVPCDKCNKP